MGASVIAAWRWLPAFVRAPVVAFIVLEIGTTATVLPLVGNIKFHPEIPWAFPATLIVVAAFWYYFTGRGYPAATRAVRKDVTRRKSLPLPIWRAAAAPLLLSVMSVASLRLVLPSIFPMDAPKIPFDVTSYPLATIVGLLLAIAVSAGVTEEVAFRGYLQKPLEDAYGIVPALVLTGIAFWFAHVDKVSLSHLPFHLLASAVLGLAAYLTKSLLPAIIGHVLGDALLQPAYVFHQPAFVWSSLTARPLWEATKATTLIERLRMVFHAMDPSHVFESGPNSSFALIAWVFIASSALALPAFIGLARATRVLRVAAEPTARGV